MYYFIGGQMQVFFNKKQGISYTFAASILCLFFINGFVVAQHKAEVTGNQVTQLTNRIDDVSVSAFTPRIQMPHALYQICGLLKNGSPISGIEKPCVLEVVGSREAGKSTHIKTMSLLLSKDYLSVDLKKFCVDKDPQLTTECKLAKACIQVAEHAKATNKNVIIYLEHFSEFCDYLTHRSQQKDVEISLCGALNRCFAIDSTRVMIILDTKKRMDCKALQAFNVPSSVIEMQKHDVISFKKSIWKKELQKVQLPLEQLDNLAKRSLLLSEQTIHAIVQAVAIRSSIRGINRAASPFCFAMILEEMSKYDPSVNNSENLSYFS